MQLEWTIPNMRCADCVNIITRVATAVDLNATVAADLTSKQVTIDTKLHPDVMRHAIAAAGYPAVIA